MRQWEPLYATVKGSLKLINKGLGDERCATWVSGRKMTGWAGFYRISLCQGTPRL